MKKYRIPRKKKKLFKKRFTNFREIKTMTSQKPERITFNKLLKVVKALEGLRLNPAEPRTVFKLIITRKAPELPIEVPAPSPFLIHKNYFINP